VSVVIFVGPTLPATEAQRHLDATYLPPASQGDVFRASKEKPFAIGIIDGYFDRVPAVWHKEILWAMAQGIHVFGAASMGALRAAELTRYGMKGVGAIYEAFHSGALEDDDEVAVAHGDANEGYRAVSEAMVNIRATLHHARAAGAVDEGLRERLEELAKGLFYPDRSYSRLFGLALERGLPSAEIGALKAFVATQKVDQKRIDGLQLLAVVRECVAAGAAPKSVAYSFQHTETWDQLVGWAETQPPIHAQGPTPPATLVAAEVRLSGAEGRTPLAMAHARAASAALASRSQPPEREARIAMTDRRWRAERHGGGGNGCPPSFDGWLDEQGLTPRSYRALLERQVDLDWARQLGRHEVDRHVVDAVRLDGSYAALAKRAREKEALLASRGLSDPSLVDAGLDAQGLATWYFEQRLGTRIPQDLESHLAEVGFPDMAAFHREALRELLFARLSEKGG
jgi:hypothetical protein